MRVIVKVNPPYPVIIGSNLFSRVASEIDQTNLALITDSHVAPLWAGSVEGGLAGKTHRRYVVPAGEASKSFAVLEGVLRELARDNFDRYCAVVALGGGVVGDLAGFAAASYLRGVAFYQCPTSLLAMVDASVGGKTGINLPEGKNLVGAFWQPRAVFIDVHCLRTLPERDFRQGAVELYKHGLLADPYLLEATGDANFHGGGDPDFLVEVIGRSVKVKAEIVASDERESGARRFLNLGHSLAHALEASSRHRLQHGDAVAYGLLFAARLSVQRGWSDETGRILAFLRWLKPVPLEKIVFDDLRPYLARDKKAVGGKLRWILLRRLGEPCLVDDLGDDELDAAWAYLLEVCR